MLLKYDDVLKISAFLKENGYASDSIEIVNYLPNIKMLNRVNDDYFYRLNGGSGDKPDDNTDEITVNIGECFFTYKVKDGIDRG